MLVASNKEKSIHIGDILVLSSEVR